jgi:predicted XRE-type DNA-binding protein
MTKPKVQTFANVWDAIEDTPEDAAVMTARSTIMTAITDKVQEWKVTQREAARRLGVTQPRLNDLVQGRINKFSLDALLTLAGRAELRVVFEVRSAAIAAARALTHSNAAPQLPTRVPAPSVRTRRAPAGKRA